MLFSSRTNWNRNSNKLAAALEERRRAGKPVLDLTKSNPTECGIIYPQNEILAALSLPSALHYQPDPRGLISARESVVEYYRSKGVTTDTSRILLTSGTSEAYSTVFKLLCNSGESVLVPRPSYPLFDFLAGVNDITVTPYQLRFDGGWHIDFDSIARSLNPGTKAIVLVNPHNPTGMVLCNEDLGRLNRIARGNNVALIVDEVFIDYGLDPASRIISTACNEDALTFTLNGISKSLGLPQMKLGWIAVSGERAVAEEAAERMEILCDTFLSVNTPVQVALPHLFHYGLDVQHEIRSRILANYAKLRNGPRHTSPISYFTPEAGWYGILRMPQVRTDEEWALELLQDEGIYLHPGYFFEFSDEGYLVVSLLTAESDFATALDRIEDFVVGRTT